jgi:hypothetical protein
LDCIVNEQGFQRVNYAVAKVFGNKSLLIAYFLFLVGMAVHLLLPTSGDSLLFMRFLIGIFTFILIPGLFVIHLLNDDKIKNFGFALIVGFLFQLLNVFIIWCLNTILGTINFVFVLYILTFSFTTFLFLLTTKIGREMSWKSYLEIDRFLLFTVILFVLVALRYQFFFPSPHSDGAAYLDLARNVVGNNIFSSNFILPLNNWSAVQWSTGLIDYFFGYSAIAVFFTLGSISLFSAKVMLIFAGALTLFPLFMVSKKLFSRQVACIAVFLTSISPIMLAHVSLVGGPEVVSLLYMLTTFSLLLFLNEGSSKMRLSFLAGITFFAAWGAWLLTGYLLLMIIPCFFLLYSYKAYEKFNWYAFMTLVFLVAFFFLDWRVTGHFTYEYLLLPFPLGFFSVALIASRLNRRIRLPKFYIIFLATALCSLFILFYVPRLTSPQFINFYTTHYSTAQENVAAHITANVDILNRIFDLDRVRDVLNSYLYGQSFTWAGLLNSMGTITIFLAIVSFARLEKIRQTLLIFCFPALYMLLWILVGPDWVIQPRYLLCVAPFYLILVASAIGLLISNLDLVARLKEIRVKIFNRSSHFGKNPAKILVGILVVSTLIAFWQPVYVNSLENGAYWNYEKKLGWSEAIEWVKQNTKPDEILMARQANFWAWFSDRKTVQLSDTMVEYDYGNIDKVQLINIIRQFKVNYLIVDNALYAGFPKLVDLYLSPSPFYGSPIVFQHENEQGLRTIIYNVTHMQNWDEVTVVDEVNPILITGDNQTDYWTPFGLYSGEIGLPILNDTDSVTVKGVNSLSIETGSGLYKLWGIMHTYSSNQNWSSSEVMSFYWYGQNTGKSFRIDIHTPDGDNQYQKTFVDDFSGWKKITIPLNTFTATGSPTWKEVKTVYLLCISPNASGSWYADNFFLDVEYLEEIQADGTTTFKIAG